jgi:hypothetical protein
MSVNLIVVKNYNFKIGTFYCLIDSDYYYIIELIKDLMLIAKMLVFSLSFAIARQPKHI